jgi:hypothetical protein
MKIKELEKRIFEQEKETAMDFVKKGFYSQGEADGLLDDLRDGFDGTLDGVYEGLSAIGFDYLDANDYIIRTLITDDEED